MWKPWSHSGALERMSLLALGLTPLFLGFILVELFALMTSPGRRLRQSGAAGRARLNRAALITGLLIAALQAAGIARGWRSCPAPAAPLSWGPPGRVSCWSRFLP